MKKTLINLCKMNFCEWILLAALILSGGFNEFVSCLIAVALSVLLIIKIKKEKVCIVDINLTSVSLSVLVLGYLISAFYAVDSGMALLGFFKFLPVVLFMLLLMQSEKYRKETVDRLPYFALILGLLSFIFMFIPVIKDYFLVSDRLAGFFQYPNTFALFLLVGELVVLTKDKLKSSDIAIAAILMILLLFTGSRAVFVLGIFSNFLIIFFRKGKKHKIILCAVLAVLAVAVLLLYPVMKDNEIFSRYLSISLSESTFIGRFLYCSDALPVILKNPFGMGYMGYYYIQQSIQTGVYSVKFIHNDLLQILLDVGWIPFLLFVSSIVKSLFRKGKSFGTRIILLTIILHSLFDFDLQFTAMFMVLILFLDFDTGRKVEIKNNRFSVVIACASLGCVSLYFSVALGLSHFGMYIASDAMYPLNTQNKISLMLESDDIATQNKTADSIIKNNEYVQISYSAKARYAFSQGDFESLINYKNKIFKIAPFSYDEYEEYCYMLIQGVELYRQSGDEYSAEYCNKELFKTARKLSGLNEKLSELGKMIYDQPQTELPQDIQEYISANSEEADR